MLLWYFVTCGAPCAISYSIVYTSMLKAPHSYHWVSHCFPFSFCIAHYSRVLFCCICWSWNHFTVAVLYICSGNALALQYSTLLNFTCCSLFFHSAGISNFVRPKWLLHLRPNCLTPVTCCSSCSVWVFDSYNKTSLSSTMNNSDWDIWFIFQWKKHMISCDATKISKVSAIPWHLKSTWICTLMWHISKCKGIFMQSWKKSRMWWFHTPGIDWTVRNIMWIVENCWDASHQHTAFWPKPRSEDRRVKITSIKL